MSIYNIDIDSIWIGKIEEIDKSRQNYYLRAHPSPERQHLISEHLCRLFIQSYKKVKLETR